MNLHTSSKILFFTCCVAGLLNFAAAIVTISKGAPINAAFSGVALGAMIFCGVVNWKLWHGDD